MSLKDNCDSVATATVASKDACAPVKQTPKQWLLQIYEELDEIVVLESIGCEIPLSEIYAQIEFIIE